MNEEDLRLKKIEKREKTDTALAYILIVFLLGAIAFMIYVKFIRKDEKTVTNDTQTEEYTVNYITLDYITDKLKSSTLVNDFAKNGKDINIESTDSNVSVSYKDENNNINLEIPYDNNELRIEVTDDNRIISEEIYKEIASIVCSYYNNDENSCRNYFKNITNESEINGIRFVENNNSTYVYINMLEKFELENNGDSDINDTTNIE